MSYVGGSEDDDEWISVASGRLRKPQEDFADDPAGDSRGPKGGLPHRGGGRGRKAGSLVGGLGDGGGSADGDCSAGGDRRGGSQSDKWVWLGDEIIEALKDGPMVESAILDRVGPSVKRKRKLQALGRLVAGDFLVRQGAGPVADPHRYFVPDDDWEEGSTVPFIHPHAQLHARLLQQVPPPVCGFFNRLNRHNQILSFKIGFTVAVALRSVALLLQAQVQQQLQLHLKQVQQQVHIITQTHRWYRLSLELVYLYACVAKSCRLLSVQMRILIAS